LTPTAKPVLVLFDVDETLVHTGGSGARSWKAAFDKLYGVPADIGAHTSAGETDPEVARATFKGVLDRDPSDDELMALYAAYLLALADDIGNFPRVRGAPGSRADAGGTLGRPG
jgi:phosphoglycolate phosphatase